MQAYVRRITVGSELVKLLQRIGRRIAILAEQPDRPGSHVFILVAELPDEELVVESAGRMQGP